MKTCKTQRKPISLILVLPLFLSLFVGVAFWAISSYSFDLLLPFQFKHTSIPTGVLGGEIPDWSEKKYLYWGNGIDCPGNHRDSCQDLFYQELSFRCALEEAMYLKRWVDSNETGFLLLLKWRLDSFQIDIVIYSSIYLFFGHNILSDDNIYVVLRCLCLCFFQNICDAFQNVHQFNLS